MGASYAGEVASARRGVPVVPSDTTVIPCTRAIYVGVAGDITLRFADAPTVSVLHKAVPVGEFSVQAVQVMLTGTAATDMVAWY